MSRPVEHKRAGDVLAALGVAAAVLAGVVAITACAQRSSLATAARIPRGARRLAAELDVLRRPQTAADRSLPAGVLHGEIAPTLTRLVATLAEGQAGETQVFLVVFLVGPCARFTGHPPASIPNGGDRVALVTLPTHAAGGHTGGWSFSMSFSAAELERFAIVPTGFGVLSSVVPDGVRRVKWVFHRYHAGERAAQLVTVYPAVRNNVAARQVGGDEIQSTATEYFTHRRVLTSRSEAASLPVCRTPAVILGWRNPIARWLGHHFAIFRTTRLARPLPEANSADPPGYYAEHDFWLNFGRARFVATGTGLFGAKPGVWVVPGSRGACLIYSPPAGLGTCGGSAALKSGGFWFSGRDHQGHNMYSGLVPDGNRTVSIMLANGATKTVPVLENVYSLTVKGRAVALIDKDAAGRKQRFPLFVNSNQF